MEDITERRLGRLVVRIDRLLCVGFGDCMEPAPAVFEFDDDGIARFTDPPAEEAPEAHVLEACRACPVDAITVLDERGVPVVP